MKSVAIGPDDEKANHKLLVSQLGHYHNMTLPAAAVQVTSFATVPGSNSVYLPYVCFGLKLRHYQGKLKTSRPSLRETRDKRTLGRDPDRSWCHSHTSVKLSWSKLMSPWTTGSIRWQGEKFSA